MVLTERTVPEGSGYYTQLPGNYFFVDNQLMSLKYIYQIEQLPDNTDIYFTDESYLGSSFIRVMPIGMTSSKYPAKKDWMNVPENVVDKETRLLKLLFPPE